MLGSSPRFSKDKERPNDTYRQPSGKKTKTPRRHATMGRLVGKRKRADGSSEEDSSSTAGSDTAEDASDEDSDEADDEEELPAVTAPSRSRSMNGAGRKFQDDNVSIPGSIDSMFGEYEDYYDDDDDDDPDVSPEENRKRFENRVFAESDDENDDVYQAVDDISESDEDLDERRIEDQELLAMLSEEDNSDADFLLNQIDGLSAYGFGDESDASIHHFPSSQASDSATEAGPERRVHFAIEGERSLFLRTSESPTITRALLPSALPESNFSNHRRSGDLADDLDDCTLHLICPFSLMTNTVQPI